MAIKKMQVESNVEMDTGAKLSNREYNAKVITKMGDWAKSHVHPICEADSLHLIAFGGIPSKVCNAYQSAWQSLKPDMREWLLAYWNQSNSILLKPTIFMGPQFFWSDVPYMAVKLATTGDKGIFRIPSLASEMLPEDVLVDISTLSLANCMGNGTVWPLKRIDPRRLVGMTSKALPRFEKWASENSVLNDRIEKFASINHAIFAFLDDANDIPEGRQTMELKNRFLPNQK